MQTILLRSEIDQTAAWQQALARFLPADFQLRVWDSIESRPSANGHSHLPSLPSLLLHLIDLTDLERVVQQHREKREIPVIYAGPIGRQFQLGPGVIDGQTACPACLQQQRLLFPGITADVYENAAVFLSPQIITYLAARLAAELVAFAWRDKDSILRHGYWLRWRHNSDSWQIFRGLRNPYCELCSLFEQYPSETIYIK